MINLNWTKEVYNQNTNSYAWITETHGIEAAFLNRPDFDTDIWNIRFDTSTNNGLPKILGITEQAFGIILGMQTSKEVINYLKLFTPYFLQSIKYDFSKISQKDLIKSTDLNRLPNIKKISNEFNAEV